LNLPSAFNDNDNDNNGGCIQRTLTIINHRNHQLFSEICLLNIPVFKDLAVINHLPSQSFTIAIISPSNHICSNIRALRCKEVGRV
jgi:hypothetical protein